VVSVFHLCEDLKPSPSNTPRPARGAVISVGSPLTRIPCASLPRRFAWNGLHAPQAAWWACFRWTAAGARVLTADRPGWLHWVGLRQ